MSTIEVTDVLPPVSDEELTAQALAADPDRPLDPEAVPFGAADDGEPGGLLPAWYMPVPVGMSHKRWHRVLVLLSVAGFFVINASGFCITYGLLERA